MPLPASWKRALPPPLAEWLAFGALLLGVHLLSYFFQEPTSVHRGLGWDGRIYFDMGRQFMQDETIAQRSPFVYRQLTPWLAAMLSDTPAELLRAFRGINLLFATLACALTLLILKPLIHDWRLRLFAASLLPLHFFFPLRASYWDGNHVSGIAAFSFAAVLYLLQKIRQRPQQVGTLFLLCAVMFLAVANRSSALVMALAAPLCLKLPRKGGAWADILASLFAPRQFMGRVFILLLLLAAGLAAYALARHNIVVTGYYGQEISGKASTLYYYWDKLINKNLFHWLHHLFLSYGPFLALLVWKRKVIARHLCENWHWLYLMLLFALFSFLSFPASQMVTAMPLYIVLIALALQDGMPALLRQRVLFGVLIAGQMISQRVFWALPHNIPDEPVLVPPDFPAFFPALFTPFGSDFLFYDIIPEFAEETGRTGLLYGPIVFAQYAIFMAAVLYLLSRNSSLKVDDAPAG